LHKLFPLIFHDLNILIDIKSSKQSKKLSINNIDKLINNYISNNKNPINNNEYLYNIDNILYELLNNYMLITINDETEYIRLKSVSIIKSLFNIINNNHNNQHSYVQLLIKLLNNRLINNTNNTSGTEESEELRYEYILLLNDRLIDN